MMDLRQLLKQAQEVQEKMQRELPDVVVEASVGGGMVKVQMNGTKEILKVHIDPEILDPEDPSLVQDLILAGVNEAMRKVEEALHLKVGNMASSLPSIFE